MRQGSTAGGPARRNASVLTAKHAAHLVQTECSTAMKRTWTAAARALRVMWWAAVRISGHKTRGGNSRVGCAQEFYNY